MLSKYQIAALLVVIICASVGVFYVWQGAPEYIASFAPSTDSPTAWDTVIFTDNSTGNPVSLEWDFGDGTTSTGENVAHVYENSGTYTVILTVTYSDNATKTSSRHITVAALEVYPSHVMDILAQRRAEEVTGLLIAYATGISDPLIEEIFPSHQTFVVRSSGSWDTRWPVTVNRYNGRAFFLFGTTVDEFHDMIVAEGISINENVALGLSKVYVKLWYFLSDIYHAYEFFYLQSASDIPWVIHGGSDPSEYENVVKPPQVTQVGENYQVYFYTWNELIGRINEWTFEVASDGQLSHHVEEIAVHVGDYDVHVGF